MDEEGLRREAKPYFDSCRPGDWNHALRVVKWVKTLGGERSDINLLVTAAYLHDIGWSGVMGKDKVTLDEMLKYESRANENTEKFVREVLGKLNFSEGDVKIVLRLIAAADRHESRADDEEIIVDADNLSKLCVGHVKEKYSEESYEEVIKMWEMKFPNRIKTQLGREMYPDFLKKLKNQFNLI